MSSADQSEPGQAMASRPVVLPPILMEEAGYRDEWISLDRAGVAHMAQDERQARSRPGHRVFCRTTATTSWAESGEQRG